MRSPVIRFVILTLPLFLAVPGAATIYTYDNTTAGTVNETVTPCVNPLVRTFTVNDSFTVSSIALGLNITHTFRGDLRGILLAPGGSSFQFVTEFGGDGDDNYDILVSTNTEGSLDDGDFDPIAAPFFNRLVSVGGMNFFTGNASGTWTLQICDAFGGDSGTFNRARLILTSSQAVASRCTGTMTFDWGSNGDNTAFASFTVGDVTVTQGATTDVAGTGSSNVFQTKTSSQGAHAGYYRLTMNATAVPGTQDSEAVGLTTNFSFSRPASDLSFALLDVDTNNTSWEDLVSVEGTDASGNTIPFTLTPAGTGAQNAGGSAEGDTASAPTSNNGNVDFVFEGGVTNLRINYDQESAPAIENNFMIVGVSDFSFCAYDYGDAPNSYGTLLSGGARHALGSRNLYLGANPPDGETDGQPGAPSTSDDTTAIGGVDDEDGVATFPAYSAGSTTYTVSVTANNLSTTQAATLVGFLDWNRDGDFLDVGETSASVNVPANTLVGTFNVTWSGVPANAGGTSSTYARFRISFTASEVTSPTGLATSGEVEDYQIPPNTLPVSLAQFLAEPTATGLQVGWKTETETATVGYRILAVTEDGEVPLTPNLIPSRWTDSLTLESYALELTTRDLPPQKISALVLVDIDTRGIERRHGPFELGRSYGEEPQRSAIDWASIARQSELRTDPRGLTLGTENKGGFPVAELRIEEEGLYRLTYTDLLAAGLEFADAPVDRIGLSASRTATPVPLYVEAGSETPGTFGPGGFLEFRGIPVVGSLHTKQRVYRLEVLSGRALRPQVVAAPPRGQELPEYLATTRINRDRAYSFASPNGDPWYEDRVLANGGPGSRSFVFEIDGLTRSEGVLSVDLWGVTDWPGDGLDHHLQLELNGQQLADDRFDGLTPRSYDLPLPSGLLEEGENRLTLRLPGDTGFAFDLVHMDRYSVTFPRRFTARDGRLVLEDIQGRVEVDGIFQPEVVIWARGGRARLTGARVRAVKNGYRVGVQLPQVLGAETVAEISAVGALLKPRISPARPVPGNLLEGPAEYLIITHPSFADGLAPLVRERLNQGLSVKTVDVLDLYSEYTGGEVDPTAIRSYVRQAAAAMGTRFVLLIGGGTYDPFDNLGLGSMSFLPTLYTQTDDLIRYSPSDPLFGDLDLDGVPDIPVGRFPVRTAAELDLLVAKTLAFRNTAAAALFAADEDPAETFTSLSEALVDQVPEDWPVTTAYIDDDGIIDARATLLAAFDQGPALVSFVGHSGPTVWSFQNLFSSRDADRLVNENPSLVVQWGCWNTYHVAAAYDTLGHRLLLSGPTGAAAVLGSATLSKAVSDALIGPQITARLFDPGKTIGQAMIEAKQRIAEEGSDLRDVLAGWTLLGDPALVLEP